MQYLLVTTWLLSTLTWAADSSARRQDDQSNGVNTQTIDMPIDHVAENTLGTYKNRFWVDSTFYKPGGPVIIYDNGESGVTDDQVPGQFNASAPSPQMAIAKRYHGLAVLWEHRFYGQSLPFPIDNDTGFASAGLEAYQYLSTEQALEDVVYFANHFQPEGMDDDWENLHPSNSPWLFQGASYPGQRAAFLRIRNPEIIYASWSSSAPVGTTISMPTYYEQVAQDMTANCSADFAAAARYFDQALTNGTEGIFLKFLTSLATSRIDQLPTALNSSRSDLVAMVSQIGGDTSDYVAATNLANIVMASDLQTAGFGSSVLTYCNLIEQYDPRKFMNASSIGDIVGVLFGEASNASQADTSLDNPGIAATFGDEAAFAAVIYATAINTQYWTSSSSSTPADDHGWTWQSCVEYPNAMIAGLPNSVSNILSQQISLENVQLATCGKNSSFPFDIPTNSNANGTLHKYGGWDMQPSNVMFTNGLKDPWHTISVQSTSAGAPNRSTTQQVPACNQAPTNGQVFGMAFPDGYHGVDVNTGDEGDAAVKLFSKALDVWLPCFNSSSVRNGTLPVDQSSSGHSVHYSWPIAGLVAVISLMGMAV